MDDTEPPAVGPMTTPSNPNANVPDAPSMTMRRRVPIVTRRTQTFRAWGLPRMSRPTPAPNAGIATSRMAVIASERPPPRAYGEARRQARYRPAEPRVECIEIKPVQEQQIEMNMDLFDPGATSH